MRNRWILWKKLKGKETGLGWDHEKKTICADDEWWETKIQENINFKAFREEGIEPDLESKMDFLFAHSLATGQYKHTPGHQYPAQNVNNANDSEYGDAPPHVDLSYGQDDDFMNESFGHNNSLDGAWDDIWREPTPTTTSHTFDYMATQSDYGEKRKGKRSFESNDSRSGKSARTDSTRKIGGREFINEKLDDIFKLISSRNNSMTSFFQSMNALNTPTSSSLKDEKIMSITDALAKLCTLGELVPGSPEFSFAVTMIEDPQKRLI